MEDCGIEARRNGGVVQSQTVYKGAKQGLFERPLEVGEGGLASGGPKKRGLDQPGLVPTPRLDAFRKFPPVNDNRGEDLELGKDCGLAPGKTPPMGWGGVPSILRKRPWGVPAPPSQMLKEKNT